MDVRHDGVRRGLLRRFGVQEVLAAAFTEPVFDVAVLAGHGFLRLDVRQLVRVRVKVDRIHVARCKERGNRALAFARCDCRGKGGGVGFGDGVGAGNGVSLIPRRHDEIRAGGVVLERRGAEEDDVLAADGIQGDCSAACGRQIPVLRGLRPDVGADVHGSPAAVGAEDALLALGRGDVHRVGNAGDLRRAGGGAAPGVLNREIGREHLAVDDIDRRLQMRDKDQRAAVGRGA